MMAPKPAQAVWIHGHGMQIEDTHTTIQPKRSGFCFYVEGKSGTSNWLHIDIPTPAVSADHRMRVGSVMLIFRTLSADTIVRDVHVYDGDVKIAEHNNVNLTGDVGWVRFDVPTHPEAQSRIGIAIGVSFGVEPMVHGITFTAAGCDFLP